MPFGYTLNFDIVTEAASRGFLVLACIWLHRVLRSVFGYTCHRRCIARFSSVSMYLATPCTLTRIWLHLVTNAASRGFLVLACRLATPCNLTCIWLHLVTDAASRGFLVLACRLATP